MSRMLLINAAEEEECRIALINEGRLEYIDRALRLREQYKGNIYKGQVVRIEPSLQAAFVDFSPSHRAGFLPMAEIAPEYYSSDDGDDEHRGRPRIEDVVKRGQELIVQVIKEETGKKGAALSTYISLAGSYLVLMPGNENGGISRKIEDEEQRKRLKKIVAELKIPEKMGIIVRTAGMGRTKTELNRDLQAQLRLWKDIEKKAAAAKPLTLLHQEADVLIRTLRDNFSTDIDEVLCDTEEAFERTRAFIKASMPRYANRVKLYEDSVPIFARYRVEEQLEQLANNRVTLPSGGWIVLEQTEAMVCVDVNSGRATQERGIEKTALRTNLEAAEEVARQLRLRDLGGLVVIDFIDMKDSKHLRQVERTLKAAMKVDRARHELGKVSKFCIMELSRQRLKSRNHSNTIRCPRCGGSGTIPTPESEALSVLRMITAHASRGTVSAIRLSVPVRVARYLLNQKRWKLGQLEQAYQVSITVIPDPSLDSMKSAPTPELSRRVAPPPGEFPKPVVGFTPPAQWPRKHEQTSFETLADDPDRGRNRRRRRKKRRPRERDEAAPARELPRTMSDRNHAAPVDSLGEGQPLPEDLARLGQKTPDPTPDEPAGEDHRTGSQAGRRYQDRRSTSDGRNRTQAQSSTGRTAHSRSSSSSSQSASSGQRRGRSKTTSSRSTTRSNGKRKDKRDTRRDRKESKRQQDNGRSGGRKTGKPNTRPEGLPKDEDMIHPDDLGAGGGRPEEKPSAPPPPPVQEEIPTFPWGFGAFPGASADGPSPAGNEKSKVPPAMPSFPAYPTRHTEADNEPAKASGTDGSGEAAVEAEEKPRRKRTARTTTAKTTRRKTTTRKTTTGRTSARKKTAAGDKAKEEDPTSENGGDVTPEKDAMPAAPAAGVGAGRAETPPPQLEVQPVPPEE